MGSARRTRTFHEFTRKNTKRPSIRVFSWIVLFVFFVTRTVTHQATTLNRHKLASFVAATILSLITCALNLRIDNPQDNDNREPLSGKNFRFAIVASRWNDSLVTRLVDGALQALKEADVDDDSFEIYRVPGAFEISLCALKAAVTGKFDAVICLGVIIRGDTPHFDFIAAATARGITDAALKTGVPLLFGVITADNIDQATARAGAKQDNKGYEAAVAAVEVANLYKKAFR